METRRTIILMLVSFCFLLAGCAMHGAWKDSMDMLVGTKFDSTTERNPQTKTLYTRSYPKGGDFYYKVSFEYPNKRYYIQWRPWCKYSLLVNPEGTILSWRYEDVANPGWDCVTS